MPQPRVENVKLSRWDEESHHDGGASCILRQLLIDASTMLVHLGSYSREGRWPILGWFGAGGVLDF